MGPENTSSSRYIAILEDDEMLRRAMARFIAASSFRVQTFASVREFFNSIGHQLPFCLILDLNMPDMTGLAILDHIRGDTGLRIPTIVMTGHDDPYMRDRCETAGAIAFFVKPVPGYALLEAIESVALRSRCGDAMCKVPYWS